MLTNQLLGNLSLNLSNMDRLQNQLSTGRKYGHISDDPSALIYGQAARNKLARLSHFQSSVSTAQTWLTQGEAGIMELQKVLGNVYEELVSAGSVKTAEDKRNVAMMVSQLRDHYLDTLNASYGDRFVFAGYNTPGDHAEGRDPTIKPFTLDSSGNLLFNGFNTSIFDGMPSGLFNINLTGMDDAQIDAAFDAAVLRMTDESGNPLYPGGFADFQAVFPDIDKDSLLMMHQLMNDVINFDVGPGISMPVTVNGLDIIFFTTRDDSGNFIIRNTFSLLDEVHLAINGDIENNVDPETTDTLTKLIKLVQDSQNHLLVKTAEIGGRQRRLELLEARYEQDNLNYENMRSDAEDANLAEVIMYLRMSETVYQAALSAGARIIQPSLMDFLR
jgi:flagellar hook-associated protein 3 FlgL